jgi:hypothetical protein
LKSQIPLGICPGSFESKQHGQIQLAMNEIALRSTKRNQGWYLQILSLLAARDWPFDPHDKPLS